MHLAARCNLVLVRPDSHRSRLGQITDPWIDGRRRSLHRCCLLSYWNRLGRCCGHLSGQARGASDTFGAGAAASSTERRSLMNTKSPMRSERDCEHARDKPPWRVIAGRRLHLPGLACRFARIGNQRINSSPTGGQRVVITVGHGRIVGAVNGQAGERPSNSKASKETEYESSSSRPAPANRSTTRSVSLT